MYSRVYSCELHGVEGILIKVEADVRDGLPALNMVGFLSQEVREAGERVRTALKNQGFTLPPRKITVNLSPADTRKEGSLFDLPIAISILCAMEDSVDISNEFLNDTLVVGELSLNGQILRINGVLPITDFSKKSGFKRIIVPYDNAYEGAMIEGIDVIGVKNIYEVMDYIKGRICIPPCKLDISNIFKTSNYEVDFSQIHGQRLLKRALEIAVAGRHNILMSGAPGAGKSMIAKSIPSIMPDVTFEESIDITKIYSICGMVNTDSLIMTKRPFRSPHHTVTKHALIGGGSKPKPGEISLAHGGVLFLDEFPEFNKQVIEVLRQPLEDRKITINRLGGNYTYNADFMLVAAMNPCPCGMYPDTRKCTCTLNDIKRYNGRISKAILDRIDINVFVRPVSYDDLTNNNDEEDSIYIRKRIVKAVAIQSERYKDKDIFYNSSMSNNDINEYCKISKEGHDILRDAYDKLGLSARGTKRILKVARTIADLDDCIDILPEHIKEALSLRINENM